MIDHYLVINSSHGMIPLYSKLFYNQILPLFFPQAEGFVKLCEKCKVRNDS